MGLEHVRDYVEISDCPILLGALITDLNLGIYAARLERRCAIYAAKDRVTDAFQMSGIKIATAARLGMNPIVVLLDTRRLRHRAPPAGWRVRRSAPLALCRHPEHPRLRLGIMVDRARDGGCVGQSPRQYG